MATKHGLINEVLSENGRPVLPSPLANGSLTESKIRQAWLQKKQKDVKPLLCQPAAPLRVDHLIGEDPSAAQAPTGGGPGGEQAPPRQVMIGGPGLELGQAKEGSILVPEGSSVGEDGSIMAPDGTVLAPPGTVREDGMLMMAETSGLLGSGQGGIFTTADGIIITAGYGNAPDEQAPPPPGTIRPRSDIFLPAVGQLATAGAGLGLREDQNLLVEDASPAEAEATAEEEATAD
jgi:hypothetical protein